ncbi:MAG: hypothetical protein OEU32_18205, partial [Acidimicrobiia bacterium]|nr:hypothetical protein [Acidimicrobiia bacterium]
MTDDPVMISGSVQHLRVLVSGCASGIGRAVTQLLAAEGAAVVGLDINEPDFPIDEFLLCDLSRPTSIDALVARL